MYLQSRQALEVVKSPFPDIWNFVKEDMSEKETEIPFTRKQNKAKQKQTKKTEHLEN